MQQAAHKPPSLPPRWDDYLGLLTRDFSAVDTVVFTGPSGSGKSTQIRLVCEQHPQFSPLRRLRVDPRIPSERQRARAVAREEAIELLIIDEILSPRDLWHARPLVAAARKCLVASHLPAWLIGRGARTRCFDTRSGAGKLARYLDGRGVAYGPGDIDLYVSRYGAVYTELQVILETCPTGNLREAMEQFHRFQRIRRRRCRRL